MRIISKNNSCYISKSKTNCGPCSFINLIGLKGNLALERKLSSVGRIKPFHASDYTSFLIWADKYWKNIEVYTTSTTLNEKMLNLMIHFEKIQKDKRNEFKRMATERHKKLNKKFSNKIIKIKKPLEKLDFLLRNGFKVAVLISDFYMHKKIPTPHWIVAFKKSENLYYFMDSVRGIISLSEHEIEKGFELNKKNGFYPQLVVLKE